MTPSIPPTRGVVTYGKTRVHTSYSASEAHENSCTKLAQDIKDAKIEAIYNGSHSNGSHSRSFSYNKPDLAPKQVRLITKQLGRRMAEYPFRSTVLVSYRQKVMALLSVLIP